MQSRPARSSGWRLDGPGLPGPAWVPMNLDGCLPRALSYLDTFPWNSLVGRARLREALPTTPDLEQPHLPPLTGRGLVTGLDQAGRSPLSHAAPLGPPASWVTDRCGF